MRILVIAPHPDDEVYGCGGTIAKYTKQCNDVHLLIMTQGYDLFDKDLVIQTRNEAMKASDILGIKKTYFAELPTVRLDTIPQYKINGIISDFLKEIKPDILFIPFLAGVSIELCKWYFVSHLEPFDLQTKWQSDSWPLSSSVWA